MPIVGVMTDKTSALVVAGMTIVLIIKFKILQPVNANVHRPVEQIKFNWITANVFVIPRRLNNAMLRPLLSSGIPIPVNVSANLYPVTRNDHRILKRVNVIVIHPQTLH
jgi:hypothetical protein